MKRRLADRDDEKRPQTRKELRKVVNIEQESERQDDAVLGQTRRQKTQTNACCKEFFARHIKDKNHNNKCWADAKLQEEDLILAMKIQMEEYGFEDDHEKVKIYEEFTSQREKLIEFLSKASAFDIEDVDTSGSCQFDALAHQLIRARNSESIQIDHEIVRREVVSWLRGNMCIFRDFPQDEKYPTPDEYLTAMSSNGTWGDSHTLFAAANHYNVNIEIFSSDRTKYSVCPFQGSGNKTIFLGYLNHIHYVSLKSKGSPSLKLSRDGSMKTYKPSSDPYFLFNEKSSILPDVSSLLGDLAAIVKSDEVGEDVARLDSFVQGTLKNSDRNLGKAVIFIGRNSVGKSWILNLLMQMTLKPDAIYEKKSEEGEAYAFFKQGGRDGLLTKDYMFAGNPIRHVCPRGYMQPGLEEGEIVENVPLLTKRLIGYCELYPINPKEIGKDPFLLPSQDFVANTTTPALTTLLHGSTWQLLVYYKTADQIKSEAYDWVKFNQGQDSDEGSGGGGERVQDAHFIRAMRERFEFAVSEEQAKDEEFTGITCKDDIVLHKHILEIAGKVMTFEGSGKNSNEDRRYTRDNLSAILCTSAEDKDNKKPKFLRAVYVFCPCDILEDGGQITDSPGSEDADPFKKESLFEGLRDHETVVMVLDKSLQGAESTCRALFSSGFISNMIKYPTKYQLVILNYREKSQDNFENLQVLLQGDERQLADLKKENLEFEISSRNFLKTELSNFIKSNPSGLGSSLTDSEIESLLSKTVITLTAFPTLYASILSNEKFRYEFDSPEKRAERENDYSLESLKSATNGKRLLALIEFLGARRKQTCTSDSFQEIQERLGKILEKLDHQDLIRTRLKTSPEIVKLALEKIKLAPCRRNCPDRALVYDSLVQRVKELFESRYEEFGQQIDDFFLHPDSKFVQECNRIAHECERSWRDLKSNPITKQNVEKLIPSLKGRHSSFDLQDRFFQLVRMGAVDDSGKRVNTVDTCIQNSLDIIISKGLSSLLDAALISCQEFLNNLIQGKNAKDEAALKNALGVFSEQKLKQAIFPRIKSSLSFGKYSRYYNKSADSLDYVMLLNKLRFTAEDQAMTQILESVRDQKSLVDKFKTIADKIPDLFQEFRQRWLERLKAVLKEQILGTKGLLSRLIRTTLPRTDYSLLHYCFDFIKSCAQQEKVDLRTKEGKALKKEKIAVGVIRKRILDLRQMICSLDLGGVNHLSDCSDKDLLYQSLDEIGSEMEKRKKEMFIFDFNDEEMFKLRYHPKSPFLELNIELEDFHVVELSEPNFCGLVSVVPDTDDSRKRMLATLHSVFDKSAYITSLHNVGIPDLETTDLFAALRDTVIMSSADDDQLKNAVLKQIELVDNKQPGTGWPYHGSLDDRKKLFSLFKMAKNVAPNDVGYIIAWFGHTFKCNICVWVAGRQPLAVVFPGSEYLARQREKPYLDKSKGIHPKHCYHIAALGTVRGEPQRFMSIDKKHRHVAPDLQIRSHGLLAALHKEERHCLNFDTNALMDVYRDGFGEAFFNQLEQRYSGKIALLIPAVVWAEELDGLKNVRRQPPPRSQSEHKAIEERKRDAKIARDLNHLINSKLKEKSVFWIFQSQINDHHYKCKYKGLMDNKDDRQVFFIRDQLDARPRSITMVTRDVNFTNRCISSEIPVLSLNRLKQLVDETRDPQVLLDLILRND